MVSGKSKDGDPLAGVADALDAARDELGVLGEGLSALVADVRRAKKMGDAKGLRAVLGDLIARSDENRRAADKGIEQALLAVLRAEVMRRWRDGVGMPQPSSLLELDAADDAMDRAARVLLTRRIVKSLVEELASRFAPLVEKAEGLAEELASLPLARLRDSVVVIGGPEEVQAECGRRGFVLASAGIGVVDAGEVLPLFDHLLAIGILARDFPGVAPFGPVVARVERELAGIVEADAPAA